MWGKIVRGGGGRGGGMWNSCEAPHERWCYGNCGIHMGRYLVHARLDYWLCRKTAEIHFPDMSCSTREYTNCDAVLANGDKICENLNAM